MDRTDGIIGVGGVLGIHQPGMNANWKGDLPNVPPRPDTGQPTVMDDQEYDVDKERVYWCVQHRQLRDYSLCHPLAHGGFQQRNMYRIPSRELQ